MPLPNPSDFSLLSISRHPSLHPLSALLRMLLHLLRILAQFLHAMRIRNMSSLLHSRSRQHPVIPGLQCREFIDINSGPESSCYPSTTQSATNRSDLSKSPSLVNESDGMEGGRGRGRGKGDEPPVSDISNGALITHQIPTLRFLKVRIQDPVQPLRLIRVPLHPILDMLWCISREMVCLALHPALYQSFLPSLPYFLKNYKSITKVHLRPNSSIQEKQLYHHNPHKVSHFHSRNQTFKPQRDLNPRKNKIKK
jgi:hypothetical protein